MSHVDDGTLHAYLDGEIGERERERIEAHLADCDVCRERLDEARASGQLASAAMAELEPGPVHGPPWREIEERGAARVEAARTRSWVRPSLAWAAVIVMAFALGWLTHSYQYAPDVGFLAEEARQPASAATERPQPVEELRVQRLPDTEAVIGEPGRGVGGVEAERVAQEDPAQTRPKSSQETEQAAPGKATPPEETATDERQDAPAAARLRVQTPPTEVADQLAQREAEARERKQEGQVEAFAEPAEPQAVVPGLEAQRSVIGAAERDEVDPERFFTVRPEEAAVWLDRELRTLPELDLRRVEVGPGSAVEGGLPGLPAVKLVYADAAGNEIVLVQQRVADVDVSAGLAETAIIVEPAGLRTYRWHDEAGYRLILTARVSGDSLRALADRVR